MYGRFRYIARLTPFPIAPATLPGADMAGGTKGNPCRLSDKWLDAVRRINTEHAANYILKDRSGWINSMPLAERVGFAGNVVELEEYYRGSWRVRTLVPTDPVPDKSNRLFVHRFTCVDPLGRPRLPGDGIEAYVFLLASGSFWIKETMLDVFTYMPQPVYPGGAPADLAGYPAVVLRGTVVRQQPGGVKIYVTDADTIMRVISEVNGWCKVGEKRWVDAGRVRPIEP